MSWHPAYPGGPGGTEGAREPLTGALPRQNNDRGAATEVGHRGGAMDPRHDRLQARLGAAMAHNTPGGTDPHVVVLMPSFSIGETTFLHYAEAIPALEHRYLAALPLLERVPGCRMVYLCTTDPGPEVLDYHLSLVAPEAREDVRRRFRLITVEDPSLRPLAPKILDRPDVLDRVRNEIDGLPAYIEPWNVTEHEMAVAERLDVPIHGTTPDLWPLGFKSAGRRLFREAGVPVPAGVEDVRTVAEVLAAIEHVRAVSPSAPGVVVKHDNAGSGDGNRVIRFDAGPPEAVVHGLEDWFLHDLEAGGVVEELVVGADFTSPSAQIDVGPDGEVHVRATHEQLLGGPDGQTFAGCRFPARAEYAADLARHAAAVGRRIAERGIVGRVAVDFAAARDEHGHWRTWALEMNLRKGGTTHPYAALRNLVPGHYDAGAGRWIAEDGTSRAYLAIDSVQDPAWVGLAPAALVDHLARADLGFDRSTRTGVVLHMLSGLTATGRLGLIAIGADAAGADALHAAVLTRMATAPGAG